MESALKSVVACTQQRQMKTFVGHKAAVQQSSHAYNDMHDMGNTCMHKTEFRITLKACLN